MSDFLFFIISLQVLKRLQIGSLFSPLAWKAKTLSAHFHRRDAASLWLSSCPPLDLLQWNLVLSVLRTQNWKQCSRWGLTRVENPLSRPAGHAGFDAAHDVGFLGCKHTHWSMSSFSSARMPMSFSTGLLQMIFSQSVPMSGSAMTRVQHTALGLAELHETRIDPLLKFSQVPLGGILFFNCLNLIAQLQVICRLSEDAASKPEPWGMPLITGLFIYLAYFFLLSNL